MGYYVVNLAIYSKDHIKLVGRSHTEPEYGVTKEDHVRIRGYEATMRRRHGEERKAEAAKILPSSAGMTRVRAWPAVINRTKVVSKLAGVQGYVQSHLGRTWLDNISWYWEGASLIAEEQLWRLPKQCPSIRPSWMGLDAKVNTRQVLSLICLRDTDLETLPWTHSSFMYRARTGLGQQPNGRGRPKLESKGQ